MIERNLTLLGLFMCLVVLGFAVLDFGLIGFVGTLVGGLVVGAAMASVFEEHR